MDYFPHGLNLLRIFDISRGFNFAGNQTFSPIKFQGYKINHQKKDIKRKNYKVCFGISLSHQIKIIYML